MSGDAILCATCSHDERLHLGEVCGAMHCYCNGFAAERDEPSDDDLMNRPGVEGGIAYDAGYARDGFEV